MNEFRVRCSSCGWDGYKRGKPVIYPPMHARQFRGRCPKCGAEALRLNLQDDITEALGYPQLANATDLDDD